MIKEKIIKVTGDVQMHKYFKWRLLGKGGFAKCYELTCSENKKIFTAKVASKSGLVKSRVKQKLRSEIKIKSITLSWNCCIWTLFWRYRKSIYTFRKVS